MATDEEWEQIEREHRDYSRRAGTPLHCGDCGKALAVFVFAKTNTQTSDAEYKCRECAGDPRNAGWLASEPQFVIVRLIKTLDVQVIRQFCRTHNMQLEHECNRELSIGDVKPRVWKPETSFFPIPAVIRRGQQQPHNSKQFIATADFLESQFSFIDIGVLRSYLLETLDADTRGQMGASALKSASKTELAKELVNRAMDGNYVQITLSTDSEYCDLLNGVARLRTELKVVNWSHHKVGDTVLVLVCADVEGAPGTGVHVDKAEAVNICVALRKGTRATEAEERVLTLWGLFNMLACDSVGQMTLAQRLQGLMRGTSTTA